MQPYHIIDVGRWAEGRIGKKRCESSYALRSLLDAGAKVTSIFFGDTPVWANTSGGIDVGAFSADSKLRGLLKGQMLKAGLDITVNGEVAKGADVFAATLVGLKPTRQAG
jgi:hypothetical protein